MRLKFAHLPTTLWCQPTSPTQPCPYNDSHYGHYASSLVQLFVASVMAFVATLISSFTPLLYVFSLSCLVPFDHWPLVGTVSCSLLLHPIPIRSSPFTEIAPLLASLSTSLWSCLQHRSWRSFIGLALVMTSLFSYKLQLWWLFKWYCWKLHWTIDLRGGERDLSRVWSRADHGVSGDGGRSGRECIPFGRCTVPVWT